MSTLKTNRTQLGQSGTATQNFTLTAEAADGTMKLARGNAGATTQDILTVDAAGKVNFPNSQYVLSPRYSSTGQTITSGGLLTLPHGLGATPYRIMTYAKCTTAEYGYSIGDEVIVAPHQAATSGTDPLGIAIWCDSTNINVKFASSAGICLLAIHKTTGVLAALTNTSWQLYVKAEL